MTLREGDQMPGRSYDADRKLAAGRALDDLGVDYVQAGFPVTGETDRTVVRDLAAEADAEVVALARALPGDVEAALAADADVVEVIAGVSDRQLSHVLHASRGEMLDDLREAVESARDGGAGVHVSVVDAFRTDRDHLVTVFESFPDVEVVTLADTVGARTPDEVRAFLAALGEEVDLARAGVHFHDDLGVATANALAAVDAGVGRVDVSVAALGERAGNPALEEVVAAAARSRDDPFGVDTADLIPACRRVLDALDEDVDPRKAVLGEEVVTHESGLHTAAMLEEPSTFEPFDPARFGGRRRLRFGEDTGRRAAAKVLERAGVEATDERVAALLETFAERGPFSLAEAVEVAEQEFS